MTNIEKIRANLIALTRPCDATAELASEALRLFDGEVGSEPFITVILRGNDLQVRSRGGSPGLVDGRYELYTSSLAGQSITPKEQGE